MNRLRTLLIGAGVLGASSLMFLSPTTSSAGDILLSEKEMVVARSAPAQWYWLRKACNEEMDVEPNAFIAFDTAETYNTSGHEATTGASIMDNQGRLAYRAALCYKLSGDLTYAVHAQQILDKWTKTLKRINGVAAQGQIGFYFPYYITAAGWVKDVNGWNGNEFGAFLKRVILPSSRSYYTNNVAGWALAMEATAASFLNDRVMLDETAVKWQNQILEQIGQIKDPLDSGVTLPDYYAIEEICRSDTNLYCNDPNRAGISGIGYTHFAMIPWTITAEILKKEGIDLYETTAGQRFEAAFNKAAEMTDDPTTSPYYEFLQENCTGDCDFKSTRNAAYFAPLLKRYTDATATAELAEGVSGSPWFWELLYNKKWVSISGIGNDYEE